MSFNCSGFFVVVVVVVAVVVFVFFLTKELTHKKYRVD